MGEDNKKPIMGKGMYIVLSVEEYCKTHKNVLMDDLVCGLVDCQECPEKFNFPTCSPKFDSFPYMKVFTNTSRESRHEWGKFLLDCIRELELEKEMEGKENG